MAKRSKYIGLSIILVAVFLVAYGFIKFKRNIKPDTFVKEIKEYRFELTPISDKQLVSINYKASQLSEQNRDSIEKSYQDFICFKLDVIIKNFQEDITSFVDKSFGEEVNSDQLTNYYLFKMQQDLKLNTNNEELPCLIYFFERNFALTKRNTFIVGFKHPVKNDRTYLSIDNKYFGLGKINIELPTNTVKN